VKNCTGCKYAKWVTTKAGGLHPSGDGMCEYAYKLPPLPASMFWLSLPRPLGGYINRHKDNKDNKEHCTYYTPKNKQEG
jgi:hypothetical protein